ncbi:YgjV family protein [Nocardioides lijunqiniae]|uniref:YgjV family protein n=1 Tax=Nocardioides lijunqiniae TaxID=2760832 RepID=UPI001878B5A7|nr:YgjV family protein [Nocardioides lijunqiniae]
MEWLGDHWLDVLGWGGSALLVLSLLQTRVLRFRALNLVACLILVGFNAFVGVWPMVGMNVVLAAINVWFLVRLSRERHDDEVFEVVRVRLDDAYFRHVLRTHEQDIRAFQPDFGTRPDEGQLAFVVVKGDETVGVVLLRADRDVARVELDYVTPRYRDFSPGEFVWRRSGVLRDLGLRRVTTSPRMRGAYYEHVGFRRDGEEFVLDL